MTLKVADIQISAKVKIWPLVVASAVPPGPSRCTSQALESRNRDFIYTYSCFRKPCPNFFSKICVPTAASKHRQACDLLRQFGTTGNTSRLSQIGALSLHPLEFSCIAVFLHKKRFTGLIYGIIKPAEELKCLLRTG